MEDRCVCCGEIIPEGRQVCPVCEFKQNEYISLEQPDSLVKAVHGIIDAIIEILQPIVDCLNEVIKGLLIQTIKNCSNKKVVHLAFYGKKFRTRKKNFHRLFLP